MAVEQPWGRSVGYRDTVAQLDDYRQQIAGIAVGSFLDLLGIDRSAWRPRFSYY